MLQGCMVQRRREGPCESALKLQGLQGSHAWQARGRSLALQLHSHCTMPLPLPGSTLLRLYYYYYTFGDHEHHAVAAEAHSVSCPVLMSLAYSSAFLNLFEPLMHRHTPAPLLPA